MRRRYAASTAPPPSSPANAGDPVFFFFKMDHPDKPGDDGSPGYHYAAWPGDDGKKAVGIKISCNLHPTPPNVLIAARQTATFFLMKTNEKDMDADIKKLARTHARAAIRAHVESMNKDDAPAAARLSAQTLLDRGKGLGRRGGHARTPRHNNKKVCGEMISRHLGMAVLASGLLAAPAAAENFETRLSPSPLTDGTRVNIKGEGTALVQWDGNILSVSGNFQGLVTNATTAAIYDGLGIGIPGPKAFDISVTQGTSGMIWGSLTLTRKQLADLRAGRMYVQINSEKAPGGNLT